MKKKNKPIILAICGKSGSGKDTLLRNLQKKLKRKYNINVIISDTTRPPRGHEQNGVHYNFISYTNFNKKIYQHRYLEYESFNGWLYGTPINAIKNDAINIGIFNAKGIRSLRYYTDIFNIYCIYLKCNLLIRLWRSIKREKQFKIEYLRRAYNDYWDFKEDSPLRGFSNCLIFNTEWTPVDKIVNRILIYLPSYNKF